VLGIGGGVGGVIGFGWMDWSVWVDGADGWMDGWMAERVDGWSHLVNSWMHGWMDWSSDPWMDGWMDGWLNGWMWVGGYLGSTNVVWVDRCV
jgi:hypothetical protein